MLDEFEDSPPDVIGSGFAYPMGVTVQGHLKLSGATPNLEESIVIILRTNLGDRVYRPTFGCRLSELVFEPLNTQTLLMIRRYVEEALESWEPRINLIEVRTHPDSIAGKVDIEIFYQPKDYSDTRSLVFPFYLISAEAG